MNKDSDMITSFGSLGLSEWLVKQVDTMGLRIPTPVQVNCIPAILKGNSYSRFN